MCIGLLCSLIPFRRRKKKGGKPESFLTPFEREMVPMLLKELHSTNNRFYEVVCFRWYKEASAISETNDEQKPSFEKEGLALRLLVNKLARCLLEKGTYDDDCEQRITSFRLRSLKYHNLNKATRKKSFVVDFSIEKQTPDGQSTMKAFRRDASSLRVPDPGNPRRRFSSRSSSSSAAADGLFLLMGEILVRQFQCTVNMDDGNVHERELKTIVWKHFIQTLVALIIDKERFP